MISAFSNFLNLDSAHWFLFRVIFVELAELEPSELDFETEALELDLAVLGTWLETKKKAHSFSQILKPERWTGSGWRVEVASCD